MTKNEFNTAFKLAKIGDYDHSYSDLSIFDGFGLSDFQPVHCSIDALAALINWQSLQFNGQYDQMALDEIGYCGKNKFIVIGT
jgi:hypothetical protein